MTVCAWDVTYLALQIKGNNMAKINNPPASTNPGTPPNRSKLDAHDVSVGNISKAAGNETTKTSGIVTRGNGAATKGTIARGPMA